MTTYVIAVLVVAVVLFTTCVVLNSLSSKTTKTVLEAVPAVIVENFDWEGSNEEPIYQVSSKNRSKKNILNRIKTAEDAAEIMDLFPTKGKKNISSATQGQWSRISYTTYHKGITLRNFRTKDFRKKILHPCVMGGKSECFD